MRAQEARQLIIRYATQIDGDTPQVWDELRAALDSLQIFELLVRLEGALHAPGALADVTLDDITSVDSLAARIAQITQGSTDDE